MAGVYTVHGTRYTVETLTVPSSQFPVDGNGTQERGVLRTGM